MYITKKFFLLMVSLVFLSGCATTPYPTGAERVSGVYHVVRDNETLWSIAHAYDMKINAIVDANRLPNADNIEVGQKIFIPDRKKIADIQTQAMVDMNESFIWPIKGRVISSFGVVSDSFKNNGLDIAGKYGQDVKASRSGKVTFVTDYLRGYGKTVIIDHSDGFQTVYAYNSENLVNENDTVKQGQVVARVGNGGRAESNSLHFEIRQKHKAVNPYYYLR